MNGGGIGIEAMRQNLIDASTVPVDDHNTECVQLRDIALVEESGSE